MPAQPSGPERSQAPGATERARRFIECLQRAEESHEPDELLALFGEEVELRSLVRDRPFEGPDGARRFWTEYLASFQEVRSRFDRVLEQGDLVILEWTTEATVKSGHPVTYAGVSLIEFDGDRVVRFRTYYDSSALAAGATRRRTH